MMHAKELKTRELEELKELINKYETITIGDLTSLPSSTLQSLRKKLKDKILIRVTKKSLISLAFDQVKNKDLSELKSSLDNSIPVLILSNEEPFKLFKLFKQNKSKAFAKPNQLSPMDIVIPAGPTNFPPGPIIGELGAVGLQTGVEAGKIAIKKEKLIVRANEVIKPEVASVLSKLNIRPIEIGLNITASYKDKIIYNRDILDINEEQYISDLRLANLQALALAEKIGFVSKDNVELLLKKVYITTLNVGKKLNLELNKEIKHIVKEKVEDHKEIKHIIEERKEEIKKEHPKLEVKEEKIEEELQPEEKEHNKKESGGFIGYKKDAVKQAQDILQKLQDDKIKEQEKPKHKSMWD